MMTADILFFPSLHLYTIYILALWTKLDLYVNVF